MAKLLKAAFAFFVAYAVYAPGEMAAHFDTPRLNAVRAELAAERPAAKLSQAIGTWLETEKPATAAEKLRSLHITIEMPE